MSTTSPSPSSFAPLSEQPAAVGSAVKPKQQSGCFSTIISEIPFGEITGEHDLVKQLYAELQLPYFPQPPVECIPKAVVLSLLRRIPILVRKEKGVNLCIGNVRLYRLGRAIPLDDGDRIRAVEYSGFLTKDRLAELKQDLLIETYLMPAVYGRRTPEAEALSSACARVAEKCLEFWPTPEQLAKLYRKDPYQLKKKRGSM